MSATLQERALRISRMANLDARDQEYLQLKQELISLGKQSAGPSFSNEADAKPKTLRQLVFEWPHQMTLQLAYLLVINLFGLFVRLRFIYRSIVYRAQALLYYHHYTPAIIQRDVSRLEKIPTHLSVILPSPPPAKRRRAPGTGLRLRADSSSVGIEQLLLDVGELTAWCASVGINTLSVYEKSGVLKSSISETHAAITQQLGRYFSPSAMPHLTVRAPNVPSYSPPSSVRSDTPDHIVHENGGQTPNKRINVLLISAEDGRQAIVDLTKTLTSMVQKNKLVPADIGVELVDFSMRESIMDEPELLISFTESSHLDGYPPWHIRLTEIFHLPDHASGVSYNVFLKGLQMFNSSAMRFGF